jgi:hypothetical protein
MTLTQQLSLEHKTEDKMLEELYMQDLANAMRMPEEVLPAGTVTVSAPEPEMTGMDKAFVGTRLNVPKAGQPTQQDREKMAVGLLDTLAGALRGAAAQTMGLPGDIRSILDMINQEGAEKYLGQRSFATTEEILKDTSVRVPGTQIDVPFPPVLKEGVPNRAERQGAVETAQEIGTFLPAPGVPEAVIQGVKAVGKAIKATKNMPAKEVIQDISGADIVIPKAPKVETKAFKNWFGESKVVDDANKPVVVYHARRGDFEAFDPLKSDGKSAGTGTFFSSSPDVAATYNTSSEHNLVPAYLSLKRPFIVDFNGANWNGGGADAVVKLPDGTDDDLLSYFGAAMDETVSTDDVARLARKQGYDGVIVQNVVDHGPAGRFASKEAEKPTTIYVAFQPEQVKSVFNKGEFDPKNPNMLLGAGGAGVAATQEENK